MVKRVRKENAKAIRQKKRNLHIGFGILIAFAAVVLAVILMDGYIRLNPWTRFYNEEYSVDIHSGRVKYEKYFLFRCWNTLVMPSDVSDELKASTPELNGSEFWLLDTIVSPGKQSSPELPLKGAMVQMKMLEDIWQRAKMPHDLRVVTAKQLLAVWQITRNNQASKLFVFELMGNLEHKISENEVADCQALTIEDLSDNARKVTMTLPNGKLFLSAVIDQNNFCRWQIYDVVGSGDEFKGETANVQLVAPLPK